jgi:Acetyltransferase (GNAT) domain
VARLEGFGDQAWFDAWYEAFAPTARRYPLGLSGRDFRIELLEAEVSVLRRPWRFLRAPVNAHTPRYSWTLNDRPRADEVEKCLRDALRASGAHGIELGLLPERSRTLGVIEELGAIRKWTVSMEHAERNPVIDVSGTWEDYLRACSGKFKKVMNAQERQLAELGIVTFGDVNRDPDWEEWFERGLSLEASGWKGRNGSAILQRPNEARFYRRIARAAAEKGCLRLFFLSLGDRVIAFHLMLAEDGVLFWLKTTYDEGLSRYSPGSLLLRRSLKECFDDPSVRAVVVSGGPDWTFRWPSRIERLVRVRMAPRQSLVGNLLKLERMAKRMRGWWAKRADVDMTLSERSA